MVNQLEDTKQEEYKEVFKSRNHLFVKWLTNVMKNQNG